jgi:DNA-binding transcriptional ArsR family regulator
VNPTIDETFSALSDPTRRAVIDLLRQNPCRAGEMADALAMTPPALSRHLRILRGSGLITDDEVEGDARIRLYRLRPEAFAPLQNWVSELEAFWGDQLQAFKRHAESPERRMAQTKVKQKSKQKK